MASDVEALGTLLMGMRAAFARGENAMAFARAELSRIGAVGEGNLALSSLGACDLQAGSYVNGTRKNREDN